MNKKGVLIANFYTFLVCTLILAVILVIFFIIISASGKPKLESIASSSVLNDADNILSVYLNSKVEVNNKEMSIPELISGFYFDKNKYKGELEKHTKEILNRATYQYIHPASKDKMIKIYAIVLYETKGAKSFILQIKADRFRIAYYPKEPIAATYIPISDEKSIYVGIWEGETIL